MQNGASSTFITAPDGLRLHARCYGARKASAAPSSACPASPAPPPISRRLPLRSSQRRQPSRRVIALDYRGRGLSDYDRNPGNYSLPVELADVLAVITALDASPAIFVGTSRGGILAMLLAAVRPTAIAGAVLNDIGPVIEPQGLMRIKGYVGKLPQPRNFEEGAEILRRLFSGQFPKLEHERLARQRAPRVQGRKRPAGADLRREARHDAGRRRRRAAGAAAVGAIRRASGEAADGDPRRQLRPPVGGNGRSHARAPHGDGVIEVPDQGHAPLLTDADTIARIVDFVQRCDRTVH